MICCLRCIIIRYLWIINCSDPFWLFSENLGVIVVLNGIWPKVFLVNPTGHNRVSSKIIRVIASAHQIHDPRLIPQTGNQLMTNATFHIGPRTVGLCHTVELVRIWGQRKKGRQDGRCWGCWALRHSVSIGVFYKLPEKKTSNYWIWEENKSYGSVLKIPTTDSLYGLFSAGLRLLQASQYDKGRLSYCRACKNLRPVEKRPSRLSVLGMLSTLPFSIDWCLL